MWNLNNCPRCGGDIYVDEGVGYAYEKCLQCGYERELVKVFRKHHPVATKRRANLKRSRLMR